MVGKKFRYVGYARHRNALKRLTGQAREDFLKTCQLVEVVEDLSDGRFLVDRGSRKTKVSLDTLRREYVEVT